MTKRAPSTAPPPAIPRVLAFGQGLVCAIPSRTTQDVHIVAVVGKEGVCSCEGWRHRRRCDHVEAAKMLIAVLPIAAERALEVAAVEATVSP